MIYAVGFFLILSIFALGTTDVIILMIEGHGKK